MKTRYVYYKEDTGLITEIRNDESDSGLPFIICNLDEVIDILSMKASTIDYIVAYNKIEEKHILIKKDNIIRLRKQSKEPIKIPYKETLKSDLKLIYYAGNTLEVSLNLANISPLYQTDFRSQVSFEKGTEFRILVKEKDTEKLLNEYIIDGQELMDEGQIYFELDKGISSDNVEFYTYNLLPEYSWHKEDVIFITPMKQGKKYDVHTADTKLKKDEYFYHLIAEIIDGELKITNKIKNLNLIRFENDIDFYIVDKLDPNILYGKFSLGIEELKMNEIVVPFDESLKGKTIMYNHKYISVLVKE